MTSFYLSSSSLNYKQYESLIVAGTSFGWKPQYIWGREAFKLDNVVKRNTLIKAIKGISKSDIYIACIPGSCSTCIEIGMAYTLCSDVFLVAKNPVHFVQTGLADAYMSSLPHVKRVCCEVNEIAAMLSQEFFYLINNQVL